jgi:hypothetical protein
MKRSDTKSMVFSLLGFIHHEIFATPLKESNTLCTKIRHVMRQKAIGIIEKVTNIFKLQAKLLFLI